MSKNDITGDTIASKPGSEAFRNRFELIEWGKPKSEPPKDETTPAQQVKEDEKL